LANKSAPKMELDTQCTKVRGFLTDLTALTPNLSSDI